MATVAIEATGVAKAFGPTRALAGVDLVIEEGATFGLLGPNGSGKTTLIRAVVGLVRPDAGIIRVLGRTVRGNSAAPEIGYMPQVPALYDDLTVVENVSFVGRLYGLPRARLREAVERALGLVQLLDRGNSPVRTLSGGMRQRANLACALVHRPGILLLDEPTVGVDPVLRQGLWDHFHALNREGVTLVISTHVMEEAERCSRMALLRTGRVLAAGTPGEIRGQAGTATIEEAFLRLASGRERG